MATMNFNKKEVLCKIVYYGPGLCGKTTNLQTIHGKVPDNMRGNLTSIATQQDRTLFFDLLPLEIGKIKDFTVKLQLYTVPGQVYYNASRKIVLRGVDGVVFVADSQMGKMDENIESLVNLRDNLIENKIDPNKVPVVLQYNKRDLSPLYSIEELNSSLNKEDLNYFEAIATTGQGVFNTLKKATALVVENLKKELDTAMTRPVQPKPQAVTPAAQTSTDSEAPQKTLADQVRHKPAESLSTSDVQKTAADTAREILASEKPDPVEEEEHEPQKDGLLGRVASLFKRSRD